MFKFYRYLIYSGVAFLSITRCFSQIPNYDLPKFIPPSPTAMAFSRYGEIPVDISTGVPAIEIPIFTIKSRQLEVPIGISYHAAGNRVDDVSTVVGLGWVLNGIGLVSRTVFDKADDRVPYFAFDYNKAQYKTEEEYNTAVQNAITLSQKSALGTNLYNDLRNRDKKSDRFNFQLPGNGGGTFRYDFLTDECIVIPFRPVRIARMFDTSNSTTYYSGELKEFDVTDEKGNKYVFDKPYKTLQGDTKQDIVNTSWYLSKITSPDGTDEITYEYYPFTNTTKLIYFSHWVSWKDPVAPCVRGSHPDIEFNAYNDNQSTTMITTTEPLLQKIKSATSVVEFFYATDRHDIKGSSYRLSSIKITDPISSSLIKEIIFDNNAYFGGTAMKRLINDFEATPDTQSLRLKLNGLSFKGNNGLDDQIYSFKYIEGTLPPYNTQELLEHNLPIFAQDYWGYYNGSDSNPGLIPAEFLLCDSRYGASCVSRYKGNRKPNHAVANIGLIKEIHYPTGGVTAFEFEPNFETGVISPKAVGGFRIHKIKNFEHIGSSFQTKTYNYTSGTFKTPERNLFLSDLNLFYYWSSIDCPNDDAGRVPDSFLGIATTCTQSSSFNHLSFSNGTSVIYNNVEEITGTDLINTGKIQYRYSSPVEPNPFFEPRMMGDYAYDNGNYEPKLTSKKIFKNVGGVYSLVNEHSNTYQYFKDDEYSTGINVVKTSNEFSNIGTGDELTWNYFDVPEITQNNMNHSYINSYHYVNTKASRKVLLLTSEQDNISNGADFFSSLTQYTYNNLNHLQPTEKITTDSRQNTFRTYFNYPADFASSEPACAELLNRNIITTVIRQQRFKGPIENLKHLETIKTNYSNQGNNIIAPQTVERMIEDRPSEIRLHYYGYDNKGNVLSVSKESDIKQSYVWGYNQTKPIALGSNSEQKDIFHTSFEDSEGNIQNGRTGKKSFDGNYSKSLSNLTNGHYIISYWKKSESWEFFKNEVEVNENSYQFNLSGQIDEIRFYPVWSQMTTNTYDPLIGITSATDPNNKTTYYEYDYANRLAIVRDDDKNIIKKIDYSYEGQPENLTPGVFYNQEKFAYFIPNCEPGYSGVQYRYEVPAGKHTSLVSQAVADQVAQDEITATGQANANAYGTCIPAFSNVEKSIAIFRNNCGVGFDGTSVKYTVGAGTHRATTQSAADQLALDDIAANSQSYANSVGTCYDPSLPYITLITENQTTQTGQYGESNYQDVVVKFYQDYARTIPVNVSNVLVTIKRQTDTGDKRTTTYPTFSVSGSKVILYGSVQFWGYDTAGNFVEEQFSIEAGSGYNIR